VQYHQTLLNIIDRTLIPAVRHDTLRTLLQDVRPTIAAHLTRAQQLRAAGR
jgi:hypothetical protein